MRGENGLFGVRPGAFTDAGNAAMFVCEYRDELIFTDSMGWLHWNGKNWERNEHKALELAEEFSNRMLKEARELDRKARHKLADLEADAAGGQKNEETLKNAKEEAASAGLYLKHALYTQHAGRIKAILDLARPFLVLPGRAMDANPRELNTQAGIVNLVTGDGARISPRHDVRKSQRQLGARTAQSYGRTFLTPLPVAIFRYPAFSRW